MAVAMCPPPPSCIGGGQQVCPMNDRFYKFGTPSPTGGQSIPSPGSEYQSTCYSPSELEDSGFHSDEEMQKVGHRAQLPLIYYFI